MEWTAFVKKENVSKAENALNNDFDLAAKQSITIRDASSLGIEEQGSFFVISGSEEGVERCKELLKDLVAETSEENLEKAKKTIQDEQDKAAEGFGDVFG